MTILRIIIALVVGVVVGSAVNMGIVMLGSGVIPAPAGVDFSDADSIAQGIHLFEPKHFVFPFLAHAAGTLAGALVAYLIAPAHRNVVAYVIGALFFAGGIMAVMMIPGPVWFAALDLILAYFPMAYLATRIGSRIRGS